MIFLHRDNQRLTWFGCCAFSDNLAPKSFGPAGMGFATFSRHVDQGLQMKQVIKINKWLTVGVQPSNRGLDDLPDRGFRSVLNLTMGQEGSLHYPSPRLEGSIVRQQGIGYQLLPMSLASLNREHLARLCQILKTLPKPIYIHGRVGKEALVLAIVHIAIAQDTSGDKVVYCAKDLNEEYDDPRLPRYVLAYSEHLRKVKLRTLLLTAT